MALALSNQNLSRFISAVADVFLVPMIIYVWILYLLRYINFARNRR
jgi:hypothetical protein